MPAQILDPGKCCRSSLASPSRLRLYVEADIQERWSGLLVLYIHQQNWPVRSCGVISHRVVRVERPSARTSASSACPLLVSTGLFSSGSNLRCTSSATGVSVPSPLPPARCRPRSLPGAPLRHVRLPLIVTERVLHQLGLMRLGSCIAARRQFRQFSSSPSL